MELSKFALLVLAVQLTMALSDVIVSSSTAFTVGGKQVAIVVKSTCCQLQSLPALGLI